MFDKLKMRSRYVFGLRRFLKHRLSPDQCRLMIAEQLQYRGEMFLRMARRGIYENSQSPYRRLLAHAGVEFGDLAEWVREDGVEAALQQLYRAGVYVTHDEFKCRRPIQRGSLTFSVRPRDFDNPLLAGDYEAKTGGSRGAGTRVIIDFDMMHYDAAYHEPRLLATSSDILTAGYHRLLARAFHAEPLDLYNCTELGDVAWEGQRRHGLHVNADWLCVEVLRSGKRVEPGGTGEVVVTPLYRYAMPLIRYSPGDIATFAQDPCACGVTLPILSQLEGRSQNVVPLPGGRYFAGFSEIMSHYPEIKRYQIVQTALDAFTVRIVPGHEFSPQVSHRIARVMTERLGDRIRVEVGVVDESELGARRKSITVIPLHPVDLGSAL